MGIKNGRYEEDGNVKWYKNDKYHREDGPALEWSNLTTEWYVDGIRHREGGPAYQSIDGKIRWYRYGDYHCEEGPAYENPDGTKYWFLNGIQVTEEEVRQLQDKKKLNSTLSIKLKEKKIEKRSKI